MPVVEGGLVEAVVGRPGLHDHSNSVSGQHAADDLDSVGGPSQRKHECTVPS